MSAAVPEVVGGSVAAATAAGFSATTVFLSLLVPALVLYFIYFRISRRHMIELAEKLPGPPGLPLIGNALELLGSSDSKLATNLSMFVNFVELKKGLQDSRYYFHEFHWTRRKI